MFKVLVSTDGLPYEKWLEYRRLGIGGSDASIVCGINKYKSPVELWMEKKGLSTSDEAGEPAYWGNRLESLVREEFTLRTGIEVTPVMQILQSETHPYMLANLDGICTHPDYGVCIFEAKTAGAYLSGEWEDKIPDSYMLQLQHYMAVTGYRGAYIAVLIGGNTFKWKFIERDEEMIATLVELEKDFWGCVQSDVPPILDGSDASSAFLNKRFPDSALSSVNLPDAALTLIKQYDDSCMQIAELTEQKQEAENLLKQMIGECEFGSVGDRIVTWKTVTQERLDSKALKSDHPILYQQYVNKSSHRRFSIKQIK